jgi:hypothetical protein
MAPPRLIIGFLRYLTPDVITALFTAVIGITGVLALLYARTQLKESRRQAQIQHLMNFLRGFANEPMVTYRVCAAKQWLQGNKTSSELIEVINFFEEVGLLVNRGYLDPEDTWEMFSDTVFPLFKGCETSIRDDQRHDANILTNFVALYNALAKIERRRDGKAYDQSAEEIETFWREELKVKEGTPPRRRKRLSKNSASDQSANSLNQLDDTDAPH